MSLTNVLGDEIPESGMPTYSKEFLFDLGTMNTDNLAIVAFVVNSDSKKVINSQTVALGQDIDFQYLD